MLTNTADMSPLRLSVLNRLKYTEKWRERQRETERQRERDRKRNRGERKINE